MTNSTQHGYNSGPQKYYKKQILPKYDKLMIYAFRLFRVWKLDLPQKLHAPWPWSCTRRNHTESCSFISEVNLGESARRNSSTFLFVLLDPDVCVHFPFYQRFSHPRFFLLCVPTATHRTQRIKICHSFLVSVSLSTLPAIATQGSFSAAILEKPPFLPASP